MVYCQPNNSEPAHKIEHNQYKAALAIPDTIGKTLRN